MLSHKFVFNKSKNSPLTIKYKCPQLCLLIITQFNNQQIEQRPILLFHANVFRREPALNTLIFFKVKCLIHH